MQRTRPPFRADMVGSLLRTAALKEARHKHHDGEITDEALKEIEDREIRALIKRQEEIGLQAVTDGEFRRAYWHFDVLEHLDGVTSVEADSGMNFKGGVGIAKALRVTGKVGFSGHHPMIDHFWRERRTVARYNIAIGGEARRLLFRALAAGESGTKGVE